MRITICILLLFIFLSACAPVISEQQILQEIKNANYCSSDDDCRLIMRTCSFWSYGVNKDELVRIQSLVNTEPYASGLCDIGWGVSKVACKDQKCRVLR